MPGDAPSMMRRSAGLLAAACLLVASRAAVAKPPLVQKRFFQATAGATVTVTLRKPNVAGNLLVAYVVWDGGGTASVTDSRGNTYASAVGPTAAAGNPSRAQVFYAANVAAGANVVTATLTSPVATRVALYVDEYSGVDRTAPVAAAVATSGTGATMDTGPLAVGRPGTLVVAAGMSSGATVRRVTRGWRVRARRYGNFLADEIAASAGTAEVTATQLGTTWVMQAVAFQPPVGAPPPPTAYPLKVGPTGRYLVDQHDVPFLITGDSPQALIVNLSEADADAFFADRAAAGFNMVWINLLCATYTGGRPDGSTLDGIVPFVSPGDLATPNEAYFARVDDVLRLAAQHGLVVLLDPAETGSYLSVLDANGVAKARDYGRFLGARYRSVDNIVWMHGNDFQSWENPADDAVVQAVARGIHDTDDRHIHTVELDYLVSGSLDDPSWAPLIELNASYTYYPTYAQVLADYDRPNAIPTFLVEANYEFEHNAADLGTPQILRRQEYWSLLSGAAGQLYGNRYTWPFVGGWQANLDTPGSLQVGYTKALFAARRWWDLVPDQTHAVVTSGYGTFTDGGALGDSDYATAARTPDGGLVLAYMPTSRTIAVDMTKLAAPANASWYDPSTGTFAPIAGSPFANAGTRSFVPPGPNGDGDGDWVLVLESTSVPPDTTPPSVPGGLVALSVASSQVTIGWSASTDDTAVAGYRVYRDGTLVGSTPATSFTDTGLTAATAYAYTVVAYDYATNASAPSAPLVVTTTAASPQLVQVAAATPQSPQAVVSVTYPIVETAGDANVVAIGWNDTAASIVSVADTAGNAYQPAVATFRGNGLSQAIYYAPGVAAFAGNQVTVTFDRAAVFVDLRITEYSGLRAAAAFDAGTSATGVGSLAATGTIVTSASGELLLAAGMTATSFAGAGTGFTSRIVTSPDGDIVEDAIAGGPGSYGATAPLGSGAWLLQVAAFRTP